MPESMPLPPALRRLALAVSVAACSLAAASGAAQPAAPTGTAFAARIAALSEAEGYFDTDNLVSNESSYLAVVPDIERAGLNGGAYIGVRPDQNFWYIAAARPDIAFIIDVRRDNLLLQLLFKSLFSLASTRVEYLALLCGRPAPPDPGAWRSKDVAAVTRYVDTATPLGRAAVDALRARVTTRLRSFGVPLSAADLQTIDRFHRRFAEASLDLRFQTLGRSPQGFYPTFRQLLLQDDGAGRQRSYMASEEAFQFVKALEARDMIVPVVGDLSGTSAMASIGRYLREHHQRLSLFYASNVEFYLYREDTYQRFLDNLARIPYAERALGSCEACSAAGTAAASR